MKCNQTCIALHPMCPSWISLFYIDWKLQRLGASVSKEEMDALRGRLDPEGRGKIDRDSFTLWLSTGLDPSQVGFTVGAGLLYFLSLHEIA